MNKEQIIAAILGELDRAETLHPTWVKDAVHAAAILTEEAGELQKEANEFHFDKKCNRASKRQKMRTEAIQSGAMAIRFLLHLDEYKPHIKNDLTGKRVRCLVHTLLATKFPTISEVGIVQEDNGGNIVDVEFVIPENELIVKRQTVGIDRELLQEVSS